VVGYLLMCRQNYRTTFPFPHQPVRGRATDANGGGGLVYTSFFAVVRVRTPPVSAPPVWCVARPWISPRFAA
jgi:hypothetical protein